MRPTKPALNKCIEGTRDERVYLCEQSFILFAIYYFQHYFKYTLAPYHYEMGEDLHDLIEGKIKEVAWIQFRESGKSTMLKLFIIWLVCYKKKKYINIDSFDKENSERILFDVAYELVNNARLKADFGVLFSKERSISEVKQNRINNFVTENGIRVEAHSTQESVRGRLHLNQRPDFLACDDIENNKTKDSQAYTKQVKDHITEAMAGMAPDGCILYLGNYITEYGNIAWLMDRSKTDTGIRIRNVPLVIGETPSWEAKYALTDEEAQKTGKVSIEGKRRQLGSLVFSYEMMNQPVDEATAFFKKEWFQVVSWEDLREKQTSCYVTLDTPSRKEGEVSNTGDYCGISIAWVDSEGKWILKSYRKRLSPTEIITTIFDLYNWLVEIGTPPIKFAWEDTAFTRGLEIAFREERKKRNVFLVMDWLKPAGRNKEDRIRTALLGRYEARQMFHLADECYDLEQELLRFPNAENDDACDSLSYIADIVRPPRQKEQRTDIPNKDYYQNVQKEDNLDDIGIYSYIGL